MQHLHANRLISHAATQKQTKIIISIAPPKAGESNDAGILAGAAKKRGDRLSPALLNTHASTKAYPAPRRRAIPL